jgi:ubiquinone/menaquinone biosynthesis C-methylase UbiE
MDEMRQKVSKGSTVHGVSALHAELIERSFSQQAPAFASRDSGPWVAVDTDWIFESLELHPDDRVLDVAAGTGGAGRRLAASVKEVVCIDTTEAMLAAGREEAEASDIENITFVRADAAALPFEDERFDVVVCRFALHHFEEPAIQMKEMIRCLRPGGRIAVADMVADPDPTIASSQNHLEWLRDPAHTRTLTAEQIVGWLDGNGMENLSVDMRSRRRRLDPWLEQTQASESVRDAIHAQLQQELDGGAKTGFAPGSAPGGLSFVQTFASASAVKPL